MRIFYLLLIVSGTVLSLSVNAQCVPDTTNFNFFSPTPEEIPCVERNQYYETTLQMFCPQQLGNITFDSIVLFSINNLPVGITTSCNPPDCTVRAWEHICINVTGTTADTLGTYQLTATGLGYTNQGTFNFQQAAQFGIVPQYYLTVVNNISECQDTSVATGLTGSAAEPSFTTSYFASTHELLLLQGNKAAGNVPVYVTMMDLTGRVVYNAKAPVSTRSLMQLPADLSKGVYCIHVTAGSYRKSVLVVY